LIVFFTFLIFTFSIQQGVRLTLIPWFKRTSTAIISTPYLVYHSHLKFQFPQRLHIPEIIGSPDSPLRSKGPLLTLLRRSKEGKPHPRRAPASQYTKSRIKACIIFMSLSCFHLQIDTRGPLNFFSSIFGSGVQTSNTLFHIVPATLEAVVLVSSLQFVEYLQVKNSFPAQDKLVACACR